MQGRKSVGSFNGWFPELSVIAIAVAERREEEEEVETLAFVVNFLRQVKSRRKRSRSAGRRAHFPVAVSHFITFTFEGNWRKTCTEPNKKACTWLREFCSCSCLTALPGLAWVLLSKIYISFCSPLYNPHKGRERELRLSWSIINRGCPTEVPGKALYHIPRKRPDISGILPL